MIPLLTDHPNDFNDWTLSLLTPLPPWGIALLCAAAAAALAWSLRGALSVSRPSARYALMALRAAGVLLLLLAVLEPALTVQKVTRLSNRVAVLVDDSASMALAGSGEASRAAQTRDFLARAAPAFKRLSGRFSFEYYRFSDSLTPASLEDLLAAYGPAGRRTDLQGALRGAARDPGGRRLAGVVVITDGADNTDPSLAPRAGGFPADDLPRPLEEVLDKLDAPVYAIEAGGEGFIDLSVARVLADDFAFVRNSVEVEAVVRARGVPAGPIPVTLRREGAVVAGGTAELRGDPAEARVRLRFMPERVGKFVYSVEVPVLANEAVVQNNRQSFVLKVVRDRIRVLHVAGRPTWDVRFLRGYLKRNPNIDLISFFILRTPDDYYLVPNQEISLIPFPTEELFHKQIKTFDVVIFQNFNFGPYNMAEYLEDIRTFVADHGGGFAMLGGDLSFGHGMYAHTALAQVLPVELSNAEALDGQEFRPLLTEAGRRHPVTRLAPTAQETEALLANLPPWQGLNVTGPPRGQSAVLLEHPFLAADGRRAPVLAVAEFGKGRTLALATDAAWRWAFSDAESDTGPRAYNRFWDDALRWLIRDPEMKNLSVVAGRPEYQAGDDVEVEVVALDSRYAPAAGADLALELFQGGGEKPALRQVGKSGPEGRHRFVLRPGGAGPFRVRVTAGIEGGTSVSEDEVFVVHEASLETADPAPRHDLLSAVARATGGEVRRLPGAGAENLAFRDPENIRIDRREHVPVWNRFALLVVVAAILGVEWLLRRRFGFL